MLTEPFRGKNLRVPTSTNCIYLGHPPEYKLFDFEGLYLEAARRSGLDIVDVRPWCDAQGHAAFYSLRLRRRMQ